MGSARLLIGDTRKVLRTLPDASVDMVLTSPPFLALRSYLTADHPDKAKEIGQEQNPGAFLDALLDVVVELRRVLAPHGSLCVELGDTYASTHGGGGGGGDISAEARGDWTKYRRGGSAPSVTGPAGWPEAKSLCLIPSSFAWALAYGRNPWTGRELDPWRVRNLIAWCRPNPPVGALGDKFRPATSYMTVACVGRSRYFDLDAVREPHQSDPTKFAGNAGPPGKPNPKGRTTPTPGNAAGAPPLDYWVIPTYPYPGSHYATWPPDLCIKPIKAMCPERVCRVCGKPSERITETKGHGSRIHAVAPDNRTDRNDWNATRPTTTTTTTVGWTDCGHDDWRTGVVLDPFAGSGTTLAVATGHGRDAIGIDLDSRNADLARQRVGMFLGLA